jgi:predicted dinucleotide-binding enzyme
VVILAIPFAATVAALADAGPLRSRVLWSCVNALKPDLSGLAVGFNDSAAEEVARRAPGLGSSRLSRLSRARLRLRPSPTKLISRPTVFLCAEDPAANETVAGLVRDLGGHPADAGLLTAARYVEPAMMLLVSLAYAGVPRDLGLRLPER